MSEPPPFLARSPKRRDAYDFAVAAYAGDRRRDIHELHHPLRVAELLDRCGADDDLVVAGVLHDVLEDTHVEERELRERFGDRVAELVAAVSEAPEIEDYEQRKAALRQKIADAGREAAIVALADKVATLERLRETGEPPSEERAHHYRETLRLLEERYGDLPFGARLGDLLVERAPPAGR